MGHVLPKIDVTTCIDCKKCERVCPALKDNDKETPKKAYAAYAKDREQYESSTSGGASHCLAAMTIRKGGVVYGCSCLPGANIQHIRISDCKDLYKIKGSKYVQSKAWLVYDQLVKDVKAGSPVLFLGTPCQCAAVKSLFRNVPENLLLVDLVCHGVPSNRFLKKYLASHVDIEDVAGVSFRRDGKYILDVRSKKKGSVIYSSKPLFSSIMDDGYYGPFLKGFDFRKCCYTCQFAQPKRCTDITIGDFWGLGKMPPKVTIEHYDKGVSVILPNTEKGQSYVDALHGLMNICERPVEEAIAGNEQLRHPKEVSTRMKMFNVLRPVMGIQWAYWAVTAPTRIATKILVTLHLKHSK